MEKIFGVYNTMQKASFHVDEISTYALANDENGGWLNIPHGKAVSSELLQYDNIITIALEEIRLRGKIY